VDWWFAVKSNHGTKYSYFDDSSKGTKLTPQKTQTLSAGNDSCVERTLNQVYSNKASINYVGYNDENPNGTTSFTLGHSKGVLAFDDTDDFKGGFWMIQAVPKFPDLTKSSYAFASNGVYYGQNFLCISLGSVADVDRASYQMRYVTPYVLTHHSVNKVDRDISNFTALILSKWLDGVSTETITSTKGKEFTHFARSGNSGDMMEDVISPHYGLDFKWETWPNESSFEDSYCRPKYNYSAENVQELVLGNGWYIKNEDDHSKWGISNTGKKRIVCSGDLNRAYSQNKRGGGYACFEESKLWTALHNIIKKTDSC